MAGAVRVRGVFDDFDAFKEALKELKESHMRHYTAWGPTNLKDIQELMPAQSSFVRGWATVGGLTGLATFWLMCVLTALIYDLIVGGKPSVSNVPYVVPMYEGTILLGAIGAFTFALIYMATGFHQPPEDYDTRFSGASYGIEVVCRPGDKARITNLLNEAGATEVYEP